MTENGIEKEFTASKGIITKDGKVLLLRLLVKGVDVFDFPGGKQKENETKEDTLIREVQEETGFKIEPKESVGRYWFKRIRDGAKVNCDLFVCEIQEGKLDFKNNPSLHEQSEVKDCIWVPRDEFSLEKYYFGDVSDNLGDLIKKVLG